MTNLRRRLRKLEAVLTDDAGLVPHSPQWLAYWKERLDELESGQDHGNRCKIPLEAVDAIVAWEATPSG
jgi:hypothetical protein